MSLVKHCDRHPQRLAVGVCVVTRRAICRECSTQYQGVNYSKEGLEQLLAGQRRQQHRRGWLDRLLFILLLAALPLSLYLTYQGFNLSGQMIVDIMHREQMIVWE